MVGLKTSAFDSVSQQRPSEYVASTGVAGCGVSSSGISSAGGVGKAGRGAASRQSHETTGLLPCIGCGPTPPTSYDHCNRNTVVNQFQHNGAQQLQQQQQQQQQQQHLYHRQSQQAFQIATAACNNSNNNNNVMLVNQLAPLNNQQLEISDAGGINDQVRDS